MSGMRIVLNQIARDDEMKQEEINIIDQFNKTIATRVQHYHKTLPSKVEKFCIPWLSEIIKQIIKQHLWCI